MNSQSKINPHNSNWDLLGELELPLCTGQNQTIHEWLKLLLQPLQLREYIIRRVETSFQEATTRTLETQIWRRTRHIHLRIYVPVARMSKGINRGIFRIEKIEARSIDKSIPGHATEIYLFLELHRLSKLQTKYILCHFVGR